jgi:PBP1b-binding outer membrane lipoprotein LpoB
MQYRVLFAGALLLSGCAQTLSTPASTRASAGPEETFDCVKQQFKELGYKQTSIDVDQRRISGTKIDEKSRRADTQFRRMFDKIEVEVAPQADGQTRIDTRGRTFAEYTTQRGPTEVEERASEEVKTATQQLLERCRS